MEEVQFDYADVVVGTAEGEGTVQEEPEDEEADYLGFLDDDIEKTPTQRSVRLILLLTLETSIQVSISSKKYVWIGICM